MRKASFESDEVTRRPAESAWSKRRAARPGRTLTMALVAAGITVLATFAMSGAVNHAPSFGASAAAHSGSTTTLFYHATNEQSFLASADGQIYFDAKVNDHRLHFRVDQKVPKLLLTLADARTAGLAKDSLTYSGRAMTADGEIPVAPIMIPYLEFGTLTLFNVQAVVADSTSLSESILGMDFLKRFQSYDMQPGKLVLRW